MTNKTRTLILFMLAGCTAIAQAETVTYFATDHLGSPVAAMDSSGTLLWRESYSPYGEKLEGPSGADNETGYTGHQFDAVTDLTYMQARYYNPIIGRFMAVDPIGFFASNASTFGRYTYANNSPFNFVDPDGKQAITGSLTESNGTGNKKNLCADLMIDCDRTSDAAEKVADVASTTGDVIENIATPGIPIVKGIRLGKWTVKLVRQAGEVDPKAIRFTQDSISANFSDGRSVASMTRLLEDGSIKASDVPPIRVFSKDGVLYTLDNRRLYAFQQAGVKINTVPATAAELAVSGQKVTTVTDGISIVVRGK